MRPKVPPVRIKVPRGGRISSITLHDDGHAAVYCKRRDRDADRDVRWVELYETLGIECHMPREKWDLPPRGCLRIDSMLANILPLVHRIHITPPSIENGSENTKRAGLRCGSFNLEFRAGGTLYLTTFPGLISSEIEWKEDAPVKTFREERDRKRDWQEDRLAHVYHRDGKERDGLSCGPDCLYERQAPAAEGAA